MPEPEIKKMRAVVIGLGRIGLGYDLDRRPGFIRTHALACLSHPDVELVAGIDPDPIRRHEFEEFAGRPAFASLSAAGLGPGQIELIVIATPTRLRLAVMIEAIQHKPRAILLEKPLAMNLAEGEQITALCRDKEVALYINYFRDFDPAIRGIADFAEAHGLGTFRQIVCRYTGGLLTNGSHYLALLFHWLGRPRNGRCLGPLEKVGNGDVNVAVVLEFAQCTAYLLPNSAAYGLGEIDICAAAGRIRLEDYCERIVAMYLGADPYYPGYQRLLPMAESPAQPEFRRYQLMVLNAITDDLTTGRRDHENGDNALAVLNLCEDLVHAAQDTHCRP